MALIMNDEQRAKALEEYNPREHLIEVAKDKKGPVFYYPAAWRLYELRLRYPFFTLEAEIIHMDEEKGTVIVKAIGYDGFDYASSNLKGTALKQGPLKELDKVETKAKSRVARDVGIGTEYALDMDADETDATHPSIVPSEIDAIRSAWATAYNIASEQVTARWAKYKPYALGQQIADSDLTAAHLAKMNADIEKQKATASNGASG